MLAVTQFEVHVYQHGRWTIHARYPSEEREEAVRDASATENTTGRPTKVIRETYFPQTNNTETVTVYVSPKTKELRLKEGLPTKSKSKSKTGRTLIESKRNTLCSTTSQRAKRFFPNCSCCRCQPGNNDPHSWRTRVDAAAICRNRRATIEHRDQHGPHLWIHCDLLA